MDLAKSGLDVIATGTAPGPEMSRMLSSWMNWTAWLFTKMFSRPKH